MAIAIEPSYMGEAEDGLRRACLHYVGASKVQAGGEVRGRTFKAAVLQVPF